MILTDFRNGLKIIKMHFEKFIKFLKQSNRVRRKNSIGLSFLLIVVQRWSKLKLVNSYPFSIFPKNLHFPYKTVAFSLNYSIINHVVCIEILNSRFTSLSSIYFHSCSFRPESFDFSGLFVRLCPPTFIQRWAKSGLNFCTKRAASTAALS